MEKRLAILVADMFPKIWEIVKNAEVDTVCEDYECDVSYAYPTEIFDIVKELGLFDKCNSFHDRNEEGVDRLGGVFLTVGKDKRIKITYDTYIHKVIETDVVMDINCTFLPNDKLNIRGSISLYKVKMSVSDVLNLSK